MAMWRETQARRDFPPVGQFVEIGGLQVHAVVAGSGPDLVLVHGAGANLRDFTFAMLDQLKNRYRVIALDRPGFGYSDRLPRGHETIRDQARVLRGAAGALGAERPIVLGHSYGGAVALAWGLDAPEGTAAVVNVSGPSHPWDTPLDPLYAVNSSRLGSWFAVPALAAFVGDARVEATFAEIFTPQSAPEGYIAHFGAPLSLTRQALRANATQRAGLLDEIIALSQRYGDLAVPLEIVHGDTDTIVSVELHATQMLRDTDMARLTRLAGVGHMPHHSHAQDVIAAIDRAAARAAAQ
ncbi:putative esterase [Candidatus Rhodobacter oscarellae]|uniref:Putative esterase n=1 Tax=Candidatus Rhodobacter oscarellae TaxID=1675527 RepID=A0A0J9E3V4_9RHOB|nr:putative esterase [Candidatus Rhodobacter lobularis]